MTTMQDKVIGAVRKLIGAEKLEPAETWSYSNVGTVFIQRAGKFQTLLVLNVQFNSNYMSWSICKPLEGKPILAQDPYCEYHDDKDMERLLATLETEIGKAKQPIKLVG